MNVDVNKLLRDFSQERWNMYVEEAYMIKTCSPHDKSSYTRESRNIDRFLLIELLQGDCKCDTDKIKLL